MGESKLLGCWGAVVGLVLAAVIGWMAMELLTLAASLASTEGPGGLIASPLLLHELGELLIIGTLAVGIYAAVFRPATAGSILPVVQSVCWVGAALEILAWWGLEGTGLRGWTVILAALGVLGAPLLRGLAARLERPEPRR